MQTLSFEEMLEKILSKDQRYQRDAYLFVREGLDHAQKRHGKSSQEDIRHVSGQQLLDALREYGLSQYGPMTLTVLAEWGIRQCEDFGEIVFNMVDCGLLSKTESDSRDDFKGGYNFKEAFEKPFVPVARLAAAPPSESKPSEVS